MALFPNHLPWLAFVLPLVTSACLAQLDQQVNQKPLTNELTELISTNQVKLISKSPPANQIDANNVNGQNKHMRWVCKRTRANKSKCRLLMGDGPIGFNYTPVVFWHGMGDTAFGSINTERLALEKQFNGMKIFSIQIGSNAVEDELASYFVNVNYQIDQACSAILNNTDIKNHGAFNAIGFSQGGQFMRGLIQRCPFAEHGIRVKNFISLGGQHQGVYGLPQCNNKVFCDYIRYMLTTAAYERVVQDHLVQAEYWHNPFNEAAYRRDNIFLADINNELVVNETYKTNLLALENMVLVEFLEDDMVVPPASSVFGFFKPGQTKQLEPLEKSRLYLEDRIGLRQLDETNRLHLISVHGKHLQFHMSWFLDEIASVYLNN